MFSIIETVATAILLLLIMMFVLHLIRGDAAEWVLSKFRIEDTTTPTKNVRQLPPVQPTGGNNNNGGVVA